MGPNTTIQELKQPGEIPFTKFPFGYVSSGWSDIPVGKVHDGLGLGCWERPRTGAGMQGVRLGCLNPADPIPAMNPKHAGRSRAPALHPAAVTSARLAPAAHEAVTRHTSLARLPMPSRTCSSTSRGASATTPG